MTKNKSRYYSEQLGAIGDELSRLAIACDIDFFAPDTAERILKNDVTVCRRSNPKAFEKIRHHILALYPLEESAIERIGVEQTQEILEEIRVHLRKLRNLGRPGSAPGG